MVRLYTLALVVGTAVAIPQTTQNGGGADTTFDQLSLPSFLPGDYSNAPCGKPWGCRTVEKTNSYDDFPRTGVERNYEFTIARGTLKPDGVETPAILINGQYPGPLIEANWGDTINVKVTNGIKTQGNLTEEGTSLHWHGLNQKPTPWYDGVPSVHQCPIAPGKSFTYSFVATNYGSAWYHSHYSAQ